MTDREASRRAFRVGLFERRLRSLDKAYERTPTSSPLDRAERLADLVLERDRQRDDRRLCIECAGLQRTGYCQAAGRGRLGPSTSTRHQPVADVLFRCPQFTWSVPA